MVARIIELAVYKAQRTLAQQEMTQRIALANEATRFHFWTGASGKRYVHTVYDLLECPPMPAANYVLVRRNDNGRVEALSIGRVTSAAASLNLAEIRRRAAELGATEVHMHLLADNAKIGKLIEFDLRTGLIEADMSHVAGRAH
ncbi:MAG: hypothetical protein WC829_21505 [Hyphomicrobium sp.]|jgi:hypothetical protein